MTQSSLFLTLLNSAQAARSAHYIVLRDDIWSFNRGPYVIGVSGSPRDADRPLKDYKSSRIICATTMRRRRAPSPSLYPLTVRVPSSRYCSGTYLINSPDAHAVCKRAEIHYLGSSVGYNDEGSTDGQDFDLAYWKNEWKGLHANLQERMYFL